MPLSTIEKIKLTERLHRAATEIADVHNDMGEYNMEYREEFLAKSRLRNALRNIREAREYLGEDIE